MPRPNRLWFQEQSQAGVAEIGGRRIKLAKGCDQTKAAETKFHELMVECSLNPPVDDGPQFVTVASFVDECLDLGCKQNASRIFSEKKLVLQVFARELGVPLVKDLKPYHKERWVADHPEWVNQDTKANSTVTDGLANASGFANDGWRVLDHRELPSCRCSPITKRSNFWLTPPSPPTMSATAALT